MKQAKKMSILSRIFKKKKTVKKVKPKTKVTKAKKRISKRVAKKAKPVKRPIKSKKKQPAKAATKKKTSKKITKKEILIGVVTHYFPKVKAAVIKIKKDSIRLGDTLYVKGSTTDFRQKVISIQIDRTPVKEAKKGDIIISTNRGGCGTDIHVS